MFTKTNILDIINIKECKKDNIPTIKISRLFFKNLETKKSGLYIIKADIIFNMNKQNIKLPIFSLLFFITSSSIIVNILKDQILFEYSE